VRRSFSIAEPKTFEKESSAGMRHVGGGSGGTLFWSGGTTGGTGGRATAAGGGRRAGPGGTGAAGAASGARGREEIHSVS
jgi:hypothetical protein